MAEGIPERLQEQIPADLDEAAGPEPTGEDDAPAAPDAPDAGTSDDDDTTEDEDLGDDAEEAGS